MNDRSIRTKLKLVILSTTTLSVAIVIAGFFAYEHVTYKEGMVNALETRAQIIAENSNAAVAFSDSADAARVLRSLASQQRVLEGVIYDRDGRPLAAYVRSDHAALFSQQPDADGWKFEEDALSIFRPIVLNGVRLGTIHLRSDLVGMNQRIQSYLQIAMAVLVGSLAVAYVVATRLQRRISSPIMSLARTAQRVSEAQDYSIRASKETDDETGYLAVAFNEMLEQIQKQNADLRRTNELMVDEIIERRRAEDELRAAENRYRTTLDHMMEGCQIIGFDWRYLYVNDAAANQGKRKREELLGKTMMEVYPGIAESPFFAHLKRCMVDRTPYRMENEFHFPEGEKGWFNLSMEPVPEGTFILSEDITERKRLSTELEQHREHLEQLVKDRTMQLEFANKELESFSYSVSHDLRAPLRHIHGFAELLTKHVDGKLDETGVRFVKTISDSAKRMGMLIDDLLVFSRMGRSEMRSTEIDLRRMGQEILNELKPDYKDRQIEWLIGELPSVNGDPAMLRLVLVNLISNAIKYTRPRETARIEISGETRDHEIVVFVTDNGVGFDMQYVHKLFGVFERLHESKDFEGTGIGLANVRRIVQRHGGRTWAEGTPDKGATFAFSLPRGTGRTT